MLEIAYAQRSPKGAIERHLATQGCAAPSVSFLSECFSAPQLYSLAPARLALWVPPQNADDYNSTFPRSRFRGLVQLYRLGLLQLF